MVVAGKGVQIYYSRGNCMFLSSVVRVGKKKTIIIIIISLVLLCTRKMFYSQYLI